MVRKFQPIAPGRGVFNFGEEAPGPTRWSAEAVLATLLGSRKGTLGFVPPSMDFADQHKECIAVLGRDSAQRPII